MLMSLVNEEELGISKYGESAGGLCPHSWSRGIRVVGKNSCRRVCIGLGEHCNSDMKLR